MKTAECFGAGGDPAGALAAVRERFSAVLGDKLLGIYVHGSLAFGCYNPGVSDIDFIAVTSDEGPTQEEKALLIRALLSLDSVYFGIGDPHAGFEMSVVSERVCRNFVYPTPFTLHYSNFHRDAARRDIAAYCARVWGCDYDLAAHFTVIRAAGYTLCGEAIGTMFGPVPRGNYIDSITRDIADAAENAADDPVYALLGACRTAAAISEGRVLSKRGGGEWALERFPDSFRPTIEAALRIYGGEPIDGDRESVTADIARRAVQRCMNLCDSGGAGVRSDT